MAPQIEGKRATPAGATTTTISAAGGIVTSGLLRLHCLGQSRHVTPQVAATPQYAMQRQIPRLILTAAARGAAGGGGKHLGSSERESFWKEDSGLLVEQT